ncbi:MAG: HAMP domain-containing histidine kinase, partial [Anaerolinea sp.]|nr:HAMP domain-containing histidine kinase [Anaerolinea sp.]
GQAAIAIENARLFQQSDFMAEMVHELRTPLMALKTSTTLLKRPDLPLERRHEIIDTMQQETERLIRMTSDFLDLARLESGRARIDLSRFDLGKLVRECVEIVSAQAAERDITIDYAQDDREVIGDRGKLKQVILNLLTNAIKYNRDQGHVEIVSRLVERSQDLFVELSVRDTGFGISKDNQKLMFQKFYRAADTSGFTQGTGLGLAIAKHIIEAHGGAIWLESEPGVGSTFYITIPAAAQLASTR